ncbi:hypothetical protein TRICI_003800 [Trichomonascus ciferrii]|uniref:NAD(P)-binding domain-containing protein n=1 Tax=Trichomonascus ciferrii TaxID=44093 RepID=A0A642V2Q3_9ASCO|nr:hypothetical protein TRICI_003800 [Trichomonascus ciferrii]
MRVVCNAKLKQSGTYEPLAIVRKEEYKKELESQGIKTQLVHIDDRLSVLKEAIKGSEAVVFTAGSGGKGHDLTVAVDLDGAVKTMEATEQLGIKRYIMVSAYGADDRDYWHTNPIRTYYTCKHYADRELRRTNLDYTILQPALLKDESGTGKIADFEEAKSAKPELLHITRDDVASIVVESLKIQNTFRKTIPLINGDIPIVDGLKKA